MMPSWFVYCPDLYIAPSLYLICVLPSSLDDTESQSSAEWKVNPLYNGRWFKLYIFIYIMNSSIFFSFWFFIRYIIVHICELSLISIGVHLLVEHQRHLKQNGNIHHVIILYIYIIIYSDLLSLVCFVFQINSIWSIPFYYPGFVFWIWQKYLSIFLHLQKRWFQMCKFCRSLTKVAYTDQLSLYKTSFKRYTHFLNYLLQHCLDFSYKEHVYNFLLMAMFLTWLQYLHVLSIWNWIFIDWCV